MNETNNFRRAKTQGEKSSWLKKKTQKIILGKKKQTNQRKVVAGPEEV